MYYKAVRIKNGKLVSALSFLPEKFVVTYEVGKWVRPNSGVKKYKDYGLFVSDSIDVMNSVVTSILHLDGTLSAYHKHHDEKFFYAVYECEARFPKQELRPKLYFDFDSDYELGYDDFYICRPHTKVASSVKLVRQLTYSELEHYYYG